MKNEIQLKEELLVMEAQYANLVNRSSSNIARYVKGKEKFNRARELNFAINRCKLQLEALQRTKDITKEIELLKSMKQNMIDSMGDMRIVPEVFTDRIASLDNQILDLETKFEQLVNLN